MKNESAQGQRFTKVGAKPIDDIERFPIIRDEKTGLMWDRREFDSMTMEQAQKHITKLNTEKFGGFDDWRMPTHDELRTLIDLTKYSPATDTVAFPGCKNDWYRSSTPDASSPGDCAWGVGFELRRLGPVQPERQRLRSRCARRSVIGLLASHLGLHHEDQPDAYCCCASSDASHSSIARRSHSHRPCGTRDAGALDRLQVLRIAIARTN
jgi:hypothetical protein